LSKSSENEEGKKERNLSKGSTPVTTERVERENKSFSGERGRPRVNPHGRRKEAQPGQDHKSGNPVWNSGKKRRRRWKHLGYFTSL